MVRRDPWGEDLEGADYDIALSAAMPAASFDAEATRQQGS